jgi:hypothetical protein
MNELDYSSPGSPIYKLKDSVHLKEIKRKMPKGLFGYVIDKHLDENKRVFCLLQPLSKNYPAFYVLKELLISAKGQDFVCEAENIIH